MLDSWTTSTDLYTKALTANGFAEERQIIYLESTKAKIEQFKVTMDTMWQNNLSSQGMNSLLTGVTGLADGFSFLAKNLGLLPVLLTSVAIGFSLFKGSLFTTTLLGGFINGIKQIPPSLRLIKTETQMLGNARGVSMLTASFGVLKSSIMSSALAAGIFNAALTMGLSIAIFGAISAFTSWREKIRQQKEDLDLFNKTLIESKENFNALKADIDSGSSDKAGLQEDIKQLQELNKSYDILISKIKESKTAQENTPKPTGRTAPTGSGGYAPVTPQFDPTQLDSQMSKLAATLDIDIYKIKTWGEFLTLTQQKQDELNGIVSQGEGKLNNYQQVVASHVKSMADVLKEYSKTTNELEVYNDTLEKLNNNQQLSGKEIADLTEKYPDMINAVEVHNGVLSINKDVLEQLRTKMIQVKVDSYNSQISQTQVLVNETVNRINIIDAEIQKYKELQAQMNSTTPSSSMTANEAANRISGNTILKNSLQSENNERKTTIESLQKLIAMTKSPSLGVKDSSTKEAKADTKNIPQFTDPTDSIIAEINSQQLLTAEKSKSIKTDIESAKSSKDYALQLSKTTELISSQKLQLQQLNDAKSKINSEKDKMNDYSRWYTNDNEASTQYVKEYNAQSAEVQKNMEAEFTKQQKLRKAWLDTSTSISTLTTEIKSLSQSLQDIQFSIVTQQIKTFTDTLDQTSSKLSLSQARMSLLENTSSEYSKELQIQTSAYKSLISQQQISIDYMKSQLLNDNLSIDAKADLTKQIESASLAQLGYQKSIKDSAKQLATDVLEAQKKLQQKELDAEEKILNSYIKRKEEKIKGINEEIELLDAKNDAETESEERAKRLLDIEKAKLKLAQVQDNARIYVEGEGFTWQSSPTDIKNAQDDLKSLEEDYMDWEDDINLKHQKEMLQKEADYQQDLIDKKQKSFDEQKTQFETQWENLDMMADKLLEQYGSNIDSAVEVLGEKLVSLNSQLAEIIEKSTSLPNSLSKISTPSSPSGSSGSSGSGSSGGSSGSSYKDVVGIGRVVTSDTGDITVGTKSGAYDEKTGQYSVTNFKTGKTMYRNGSLSDYEKDFEKFKIGGETSRTGLHWLDGAENKPERVLTAEQTSSFNNLVAKLPDITSILKNIDVTKIMSNFKVPQLDLSNINLAGAGMGKIVLTIGDINLSGVNDVNSLSKAIVQKLPNKIIQDLYKR